MAAMGRRRKVDQGLEPRVYVNHGAFFYVHREDGRWERLGTNLEEANEKARLYNDPNNLHGTLVYWLRMFLADCAQRVKDGTLAQRTYEDYSDAILVGKRRDGKDKNGALAKYFEPPMTPTGLTPELVQDFLDDNAAAGRLTRGNRDKAALSACISWLIRKGKVKGLVINPCLRASGIKRNPESKRELYVETDWYQEVYAIAATRVPKGTEQPLKDPRLPSSVQLMMELCYRTLQRPESDIILWTTEVLATERGQRLLKFKQHKTGKDLAVALSPALDKLLRESLGTVVKLKQPLIRTRNGEAYTYDGLSAMLRRYIKKANKARVAAGKEPMLSWGFRDLKGKGATDMWRGKIPIEEIQHLCGHEDKSTTEIYVKQRWREHAQPNMVVMA